jgi:ubiquinone/menaquinone biosynthesis C-methylase UbiE
MNEAKDIGTSSGLRDTQTWYLDVDPLKIVDQSLVEYVFQHGGQELLDLGCGLGGYAKTLESRGRKVIALDVNEKYVEIAKRLGVDAKLYDGHRIPLADKSVDTIFMIEVMEHIANPELLIAELHRVTRRNLIVTVPNCTQAFNAPLVFHHMLDQDHKNFFTLTTLHELLAPAFRGVEITQVMPIDATLASEFLPRWLFRLWRSAHKRGYIKDRYYFRLIADAAI